MNRTRRINSGQPQSVGRHVEGCLARLVNLIDFGTDGRGKKLLTDNATFMMGGDFLMDLQEQEAEIIPVETIMESADSVHQTLPSSSRQEPPKLIHA